MLTDIHPKLPMRSKSATKDFYIARLGFHELGSPGYDQYLMIRKENVEIHFFEYKELNPKENYGQVYIRTNDIDGLYQWLIDNNIPIHPNAPLRQMPWGQKEFSLLDPDNNLLTFGSKI